MSLKQPLETKKNIICSGRDFCAWF